MLPTAVRLPRAAQSSSASRKAGIVHAGIGKASFSKLTWLENLRAFVDAISRAKPTGAKGTYIKKVSSRRRWARV